MGSINMNPFGEWFKKPPNSTLYTPLAFLSISQSLNPFAKPSQKTPPLKTTNQTENKPISEKGNYMKMLDQFYWECENRPNYRYAPQVEKLLNEDPFFEIKDNPTQQDIEDNQRVIKQLKESPVFQFLVQAEEIADKVNELELKENAKPYYREDAKLWKALPNVIGLDGRPMPRKAIKTKKESNDKFWDFARQFFFGLWGFRQRPYPSGRPIDVAQAIGYKNLETRYYDFIMRSGGFYYKDRLGHTRGPNELIQLKTAWGAGIIDKHTFIWGEDMDEWAPIGMVYGMERAIATWEVRLGAAATAFLHKLQKGIPPWVPLKGHEKKTYKQMQEEAYASKRRDLAVLEANDGVWPGVRTPSHALFLWASGSELSSILDADHMPNKYIPKDLRIQLAKAIPGLRPWEVLSVEQAMDQITYGGEWYRRPLGTFTTGPPYIRHWNKDVLRLFRTFYDLSLQVYSHLEKNIPGFDKIMEKAYEDAALRDKIRDQKKAAKKRAEAEKALGSS